MCEVEEFFPIQSSEGVLIRKRWNVSLSCLVAVQGFNASADRVRAILASEKAKGKELSRMVVGGFSQGGALALHVCLRATEPLAGCFDGLVQLVCHDAHVCGVSSEALLRWRKCVE